MSLRAVAMLLALLCAVVAIVLWIDRPPEKGAAPAETLAAFLPHGLDAVRALELEREGEGFQVERAGERGWRLVRPFEAEADPREVAKIFSAARDARIRRVLEERPGDLASFALAPPAAILRAVPAGEGVAAIVEIGRRSPTDRARYVRGPDGRLLLVDGLDDGVVDRNADSLQERRVVPVETAEIRRISVLRPSGSLLLDRSEGEEWRIEAPVRDMADAAAADSLARAVTDLAVSRASPPERDPGRPLEPELSVEVTTKDGRTLRAEIGGMEGGDRLARRGDGTLAGPLESGSVADLERDASEYRDRRVVLAETSEVREIRLVSGSHAIRAWREAADRPWMARDEPGGEPIRASATKIDDLLDRLRWLRIEGFESPLGPIDRTLILSGDRGELGRIGWSPASGAPPARRCGATSSWRPGVAFVVDPDRLGSVPEKAADLADGGTP